jgi:hypothetical protein
MLGSRYESALMEQFTATRSELLARRADIALACRERDVLRQKRDQLMEEYRKTADVVLAGAERSKRPPPRRPTGRRRYARPGSRPGRRSLCGPRLELA